jgi:hypothetical protein
MCDIIVVNGGLGDATPATAMAEHVLPMHESTFAICLRLIRPLQTRKVLRCAARGKP